MIGLVAVTAAGRSAAARLDAAWPGRCRVLDGPAARTVPGAWRDCDALVCFLAVGATVRLVAPLLSDKASDTPVVCVDEAGRWAVPVVGGHRGANRLAGEVSEVLGATPVVTTATDATGGVGLDDLGWPVEGDLAAVTRAVLDGEPVLLAADAAWPLPPFPPNVGAHATGSPYRVLVTDRILDAAPTTVVLRPPSLVVGVGASRGVAAEEVTSLVADALADAGLSAASVATWASVEAKADERGLLRAADRAGADVVLQPAEWLAAVPVPNPSDAPLRAVGTPSVAEAAALSTAGPGAELVVSKRKSAMATVAVARRTPRGRLAVVGIGPGARDLLPPRAVAELRRASVVVALDQYVDQVRDLLRPGTRVLESGLGDEEARARTAVEEATRGHAVALLGSGDAGVYAMASPALEVAPDTIDVVGVPGITAALAASALLGAPLGHDHAVVSLSDLHTPWEAIVRRVRAVAEGDLVVTFYNPRSRARHWQLGEALRLLSEHRPPGTPVGVVRNASREGGSVRITTLKELDPGSVDMMSVVVVGSTNTRVVSGRMVTPRGYRWMAP